ncbi:MAG: hypothetical protein GY943_33760, partial [Chloroflexi bacterium]|nr:hypothetical protein [Chloroflexota bacterium]
GYDFLIDQATEITNTLSNYGIPTISQTHFIDNVWTAQVFSDTLFAMTEAPGLMSLNSHFDHYRFFPNDNNDIFASQIVAGTDYEGTLVFSVGCHSGLTAPDGQGLGSQAERDWTQAFNAQQATFFGNTGYGYGDSDLIAYSELLMSNFVTALGDWSDGPQTVGHAMLTAKHEYYNSLAGGSFSNYDEKVLEEMTLYGLPMLRINMPITTTTPTTGLSVVNSSSSQQSASGLVTTTINRTYDFQAHTLSGIGNYYTIDGKEGTQVDGGRPIQPHTSYDISMEGHIAHGVLMVGGTFTDITNFNPAVSQIITDELYIAAEPDFDLEYFYPLLPGTINRFLSVEGETRERLVVV